ncbi:Extracellular sulfatase SULF-1 [Seminavis robusta]|uniref:Extracellular sulfatase SULF-1 n=1 Tax=Seminavis robusta TaxID=568900 RepID=A0A9N8E817_9STRA|nr:Extracellular sulfatase SULF-1 [Seminavis robusta]|eukprot:Sro784_g202000.1 Extracellular sulfatase SULF-1 (537) ;mRNA; r:19600-21413
MSSSSSSVETSTTTARSSSQHHNNGSSLKQITVGLVLCMTVLSIFQSSHSTHSVSQRSLFQQYNSWITQATAATTSSSNFWLFAATDENNNDDADNKPREIGKPLNIVLLYADDWRHDALGVAGKLPVETPFLDWLSTQKGVRFTHNCVTTSVCWISRVTLHMGQYLSRHGGAKVMNSSWYQNFNMSFPALLQQAGYYLAHIGKWHTADFPKIQGYWNYSTIYYGRHFFPGHPRPLHVTERNQQDAIRILRERPQDKPFQMTVSFFAPHSEDDNPEQFLPQERSKEVYYQNITLKPPVNMTESYARLPHWFGESNIARQRWHARFDEPTKYDKMLKNYYRLITEVDSACQAIWQELEAQGILNETMVIFTTDNGFYHGEHGLAGKWYPHEESIRVPLIIWDPRMPNSKQGTTEDAFTLNVDLAPTILGAANISTPSVMQGQDVAQLYLREEETRPGWRKDFFYEYPSIFGKTVIPGSTAVVRKGLKYIQWPEWGTEQLFNLTSDPQEEQDVIKDPAYAGVLTKLKIRHDSLREWVK